MENGEDVRMSNKHGHMLANSELEERHYGRLTGYRCPVCGACLWMNLDGCGWCQNGSCTWKRGRVSLDNLQWLPVPADHPRLVDDEQ